MVVSIPIPSAYTKSRIYAAARPAYDRARPQSEDGMRFCVGVIVAAIGLATCVAKAQEPYPSRTVKIVIPSAPGSTTDTLARIVADQLAQKWGKPTIVENIAGGAMNI